jgi:uncharacterized protein YcbK (DUF882 family)
MTVELYHIIWVLTRIWAGSVSGGFRSPQRNDLVGGAKNSRHLGADAFDVVLDKRSDVPAFIGACHANGLWTLDEGDHIHVDQR